MAEKLYKLGKWCANNRWKAILSWVLILGLIVTLGLTFNGEKSDKISIPGTESQRAIDLLSKEFPSGNGEVETGSVQVVLKAPEGKTLEDVKMKEAVKSFFDASLKDQEIAAAMDPYTMGTLSPDKRIGYGSLIYKVAAKDVTQVSKDTVLTNMDITQNAGIQTELSGTVQVTAASGGSSAELIGMGVAFLILGITFMSMLMAGIPILSSIIGIVAGMMLVNFGSGFISITGTATALSMMLGLAVGIDYALLILSRARQEASKRYDTTEAIAIATATAGSAVIFAGLTVIIALVGLTVVNMPFLTQMGIAAAVTVIMAMSIAVTLVPALLSLMGKRIIPKRRKEVAKPQRSNVFGFWGRFVSRFPVPVALVSLILIAAMCYPVLHMKTGLPDNGTRSTETTERRAYDLMAEGFGAGINGPITVVVKTSDSETTKKVASIVGDDVKKMERVVSVTPPISNPSGTVSILTVMPSEGPSSDQTIELVKSIREYNADIEETHNAEIMLTGATVMNIDITDSLNDALPIFIATIVGLGLIILAIVFRSILVPIKAIVGFLFTIFSSLGAVVLVFQDGYLNDLFGVTNVGPILNFLPILLVGIVFGLAMDYQVFLVTRMREDYTHSGDAKKSVITGMEHNGLVVSVAALIMIAVFCSFIFTDDSTTKSLGLALTAGVLIDAFLVRMTFVPAVMSLMGKSAWYIPKWLDRVLPKVDIEGESIAPKSNQRDELAS
ncbi:membrane protein YdfJ [Paenibacillus baekrokdamisoli]|uniref:Membrane protein YdfJ n=1 Tax=Paenibacillus baekrokdamisoli TaxID=1712516 RepID=A0A3G9JND1_9BACL|nr:MMPL family transporter [Paenibacillus baekrokdamisoli]MBB3072812.1 putative membrane protein YdfJ with MMPL/SSD domain [Paenibacillus baekrokdamisoli]BBH24374.1 membrane protein YdfJ [Paenibacillus baekrokdamisoli]